jgi:hypothetical protein
MFSSPGLVAFLPPGELVGDGQTPATVHVLALSADGKPMIGLNPRVSASDGSVQGWKDLGGGLYAFQFLPPRLDAARDITLRLRGRTLEKEELTAELVVPVRPAPASKIQVALDADRGMLGLDVEVGLSIAVSGEIDPADVLISASAGEVVDVTLAAPGRLTGRYVLPKVNFPQVALLAFADRRNPSRVFAQAAIPLFGRTDYPVKTTPGASVVLRVGGRQFGPVVAGADGRARVPIVVPPGVQQGMMVTTIAGQVSESALDLKIPETRRLELFPGYASLPADPAVSVPVRVAVRTPLGEPDSSAKVIFTATAGVFGEPKHEGNGIYVADFTPPELGAATTATLQVAMPGSSIQLDKQDIHLLPVLPAQLTLATDPATLASGQTTFKATATVESVDQEGLSGRQVVFGTLGAKAKSDPLDLRNGSYRAEFSVTGIGAVDVLAVAALPASTNAVDRLVLVAEQGSVANDGVGGALLAVVAVDAFGMPVPGVQVTLRAEGGTVPADVVTDASGVAVIPYTSGTTVGLVRIEASSGRMRDALALVQAPMASAPFPEGGDAEAVALAQRWSRLVGRASPSQGTGVGGSSMAPAGARIERFEVKAEPASAAPGGSVLLRIRGLDGQNRGVAGRRLEILTSNGQVGAVRDLGGGAYEVALVLAPDASGEVKVAVGSAEGGSAFVLGIPVSGSAPAADAWGALGAASPPAEGAPVAVRRERADASHRLTFGYAGSSYGFEQVPSLEDGPLLPGSFRVGGEGQANAVSSGTAFEIDSQLGRFFGVHFGGRFERYSVAAAIFAGQTVSDWLVDGVGYAVGGVPIPVGSGELRIGGRAGVRYGDMLVYKGCLQDGCVITYETIPLPGATWGAEASYQVGDLYARIGGEGSLYGSSLYRRGWDLRVGYAFDRFLVQGGLDGAQRQIAIIGEESGAAYGDFSDSRTMWSVGVGYAF